MSLSQSTKHKIFLLILLAIFFAAYSFLFWSIWWPLGRASGQLIFNWPDETANYFFARIFSEAGVLLSPEPLSAVSQNLLHARSINVLNNNLVPMSWLPGLAIFGLLIKIVGPYLVLLATPILALATVYIIFCLSLKIFKDLRLSIVIALLMLALAPWLYFANFPLLPNILFIFLLCAGCLAISSSLNKIDKYQWRWILGSLLLSLAMAVRPTEILWLAIIILFIIFYNRRKLTKTRVCLSVLVWLAVMAIYLWLNKITYGHYLSFGYYDFESSVLPQELGPATNQWWNTLKLFVAPFGLKFGLVAVNFYKYFVRLIWPYFALGAAGFFMLLVNYKKKSINPIWRRYICLSVLIFVAILIYYGSWNLADSLVKELNQISISYVRYFLPLYILCLPLVAYCLVSIMSRVKIIGYCLLLAVMFFSISTAFYSPNDGLLATMQTMSGYYDQLIKVKAIAPADSIILTDRTDKLFFPYYKVIVPQGDLPLWPRLAPLVVDHQIYYYTNKSSDALLADQTVANEANLVLSDPINIWQDFKLIKITIKK